jgi:pimeloyl-ACP methyl ester carboxylesterase
MIRPFSFRIRENILYGIIHEPMICIAPDCCIIILSGPGTNRAGPHGLHVAIARLLEKKGWKSVRFDFRGRGESMGNPACINVHSMAEDLLGVLDHLREEDPRISRFILIPNCLSSISAIKVLESDPLVSACIFLSAQELRDRAHWLTRFGELTTNCNRYAAKMIRPITWKKLFSRAIDTGRIKNSFSNILPSKYLTVDKQERERVEGLLKKRKNAWRHASTNRTVLFLYGEKDPQNREVAWYRKFSKDRGWDFQSFIIAGADRTFSSQGATKQVLHQIDRTLSKILCGESVVH